VSEAARHTPPIAAHRVLGDGRSSALVRPDDTVDWWCAPAIDDPPVLWSLLDPAGAAARWCDVEAVARDPRPAGPVTSTTLRHRGGRLETRLALRCTDDAGGGGPTLVRLIRNLDAPLDVLHELTTGGFDAPRSPWQGTAAEVNGATLVVHGGVSVADGWCLRTRLRAERNAWAALTLGFDPRRGGDAEALLAEVEGAHAEHDALLARAWRPRAHAQRVTDALSVLLACTYAPTGAVVAAPTTSLPEIPGADQQWDYRYTWLRDSSLAVSVAALLGYRDIAERYLRFVLEQTSDGVFPTGPMTDVRGETVPDEREVDGVAGWAGSQPIRVGNAVKSQRQYDALGLLCEAVSLYLQCGGSLAPQLWDLVSAIADHCVDHGDEPTHGIWEFREPRPLVSADVGRWIALDRAVWIARGWRPLAPRAHWKRARARLRERILSALEPDGGVPICYGDDGGGTDGAGLMVALFGVLDHRDRRADRLVDATFHDLAIGPLLRRHAAARDEPALVPVSWWAVSALATVGRVAEARALARRLDALLPRLQPEMFDPWSGQGYGNAPLVWSHMEAARALYLLRAAEIRARYTLAGQTVWRLWRYARARWA
jgi:hypothetical protein